MKINKVKVTLVSVALALAINTMGCIPMSYADSVPTITVGADLSEEQKQELYTTLGIDPKQVMIVDIDNATEREYLEGKISDDIIGTRTLSCAYILPMTSGGLVVKTSNLTWVTEGMLANALLTAGVENCQVFATAPFSVSGTGALTGVLKAYESSADVKLDEEKKDIATEELIITGELTDELQESTELTDDELVIELLNELKTTALNGDLDEETAKAMLDELISKYNISISEDLYNRLLNYIMSFSSLKYDKGFAESINALTNRIKEGFDINITLNVTADKLETGLNVFKQFWANFINYVKYIFGDIDINTQGIKDNIFSTIKGIEDKVDNYVSTDKSADSITENNEVTDSVEGSEVIE